MAVADQESNEWNENGIEDFGELVADVMKEIQFERRKADPQIYKDTKSQAAIVFHVDRPNPGSITSTDSTRVESHRETCC